MKTMQGHLIEKTVDYPTPLSKSKITCGWMAFSIFLIFSSLSFFAPLPMADAAVTDIDPHPPWDDVPGDLDNPAIVGTRNSSCYFNFEERDELGNYDWIPCLEDEKKTKRETNRIMLLDLKRFISPDNPHRFDCSYRTKKYWNFSKAEIDALNGEQKRILQTQARKQIILCLNEYAEYVLRKNGPYEQTYYTDSKLNKSEINETLEGILTRANIKRTFANKGYKKRIRPMEDLYQISVGDRTPTLRSNTAGNCFPSFEKVAPKDADEGSISAYDTNYYFDEEDGVGVLGFKQYLIRSIQRQIDEAAQFLMRYHVRALAQQQSALFPIRGVVICDSNSLKPKGKVLRDVLFKDRVLYIGMSYFPDKLEVFNKTNCVVNIGYEDSRQLLPEYVHPEAGYKCTQLPLMNQKDGKEIMTRNEAKKITPPSKLDLFRSAISLLNTKENVSPRPMTVLDYRTITDIWQSGEPLLVAPINSGGFTLSGAESQANGPLSKNKKDYMFKGTFRNYKLKDPAYCGSESKCYARDRLILKYWDLLNSNSDTRFRLRISLLSNDLKSLLGDTVDSALSSNSDNEPVSLVETESRHGKMQDVAKSGGDSMREVQDYLGKIRPTTKETQEAVNQLYEQWIATLQSSKFNQKMTLGIIPHIADSYEQCEANANKDGENGEETAQDHSTINISAVAGTVGFGVNVANRHDIQVKAEFQFLIDTMTSIMGTSLPTVIGAQIPQVCAAPTKVEKEPKKKKLRIGEKESVKLKILTERNWLGELTSQVTDLDTATFPGAKITVYTSDQKSRIGGNVSTQDDVGVNASFITGVIKNSLTGSHKSQSGGSGSKFYQTNALYDAYQQVGQ